LAEQASDVDGSQATHVDPPVPHVDTDRSLHFDPLQQPLTHDWPSQTHWPPAHRCPLVHALEPPHEHWPVGEHPSARSGLHAVHAWPPVPHVASEGVSHVVPLQQPDGQAHVPHTPFVQKSPGGQGAHARPAVPHAVASPPVLHVAPSQHPVLHDVASQMQCPPEHRWPVAQAGPDPQRHPMAASHPSLNVASQPGQTQTPLVHCRPGAHGAPPAQAGPSCR
jgi:hypothetical protein